jgi:hypothetical protein
MRTNSGVNAIDEGLFTVMVLLAFELLVELLAVRTTMNAFAAVKMCVGFCAVLVPPSPKFQDHEVGLPVEVSVNETACPLTGVAGGNVNPALTVPAWLTVTVRLAVLELDELPAVSATVNAPAAVKT